MKLAGASIAFGLLVVAMLVALIGLQCAVAGAWWTASGLWLIALVLFIASCWISYREYTDAVGQQYRDAE